MSDATMLAWNRDHLPPGPEQDAVIKGITGEMADKGFLVANLDKVVNWSGTVYSTNRKPIGSGYFVQVRMDPTESAFGSYDLSLAATESFKDAVLSLNKGQRVNFSARFSRQGGNLLGHGLELLWIEQAKAIVQPGNRRTRGR